MIYIKGINKSIPTRWAEVNFKNYLKLMKCGNDPVKILSVMLDIDEGTLKKAKIKNLEQVIRVLSFVSQEPMNLTLPKSIAGYPLPDDLNFEVMAKFADVQTVVGSFKKDNVDDLTKFAELCAIVAYPGEYAYKEAEKLIPKMMEAPCEEVLAVGNFTLAKLLSLRLNTEPPSPPVNTPMRRFKLAWTAWRSNLAFTIRYALWKRKLRTKGMSF